MCFFIAFAGLLQSRLLASSNLGLFVLSSVAMDDPAVAESTLWGGSLFHTNFLGASAPYRHSVPRASLVFDLVEPVGAIGALARPSCICPTARAFRCVASRFKVDGSCVVYR